ncbi:MAG TPA: hypothetical protein DEQ02_05500 [Ruminococcaceae bacterium]|nr:hypothetical protein [Oscillospiraceae bacterium]
MKKKLRIESILLLCAILAIAVYALIALFPADKPESPIDTVDTPDTSVIEYGHPDLLANNAGPLWTYIRYPQAGDFADSVILDWVQATYDEAKADLDALLDKDASAQGEVNIQFDSYLIDGRFVGIVEQGMISTTGLAHPADVIKTFNLDIESKTFLENSDILDMSKREEILTLLKEKILLISPDAQDYFDNMATDEWLDYITIGHEGIIVILERGVGLPAYYGSLRINLPYDELGDALLLYGETASAPDTAQEPTSKPAPSSTPESVAPSLPPQDGGIDPLRPMIALTFDDGPSKHTSRILDLLEQYKGHATFFVIGNLIESRPDTIKRAADLGCEVVGHSWDHRDLTKLSSDEMKAEILDTHNAIESITGSSSHMYRPPYGAVNDSLTNASSELGFSIINWSVDTVDWKTKNADAVYTAVMADVNDRAIILCHDLYSTTAEAMEQVIPALVSQGYQLVTVSELLEYSGGAVEAGKVYYNGNK